ncbi:MAG: hypothetical protein AB8B95_10480 [Pseudohongiellaceae bacterium]
MKPLLTVALFLLCWSITATFAAEGNNWRGPNAYKPNQIDGYLSAGISSMESRDYSAAEKQFSKALQAVKVNHGIKSSQQVLPLSLLIRAQMGHRNWRTINQQLAHFEWLNSEIYKSDFDSYLTGTDTLATLYLQAAADPLNPQAAHYLLSAKNITWNAISAIENRYDKQSPLLSPWLYKIVLSHFYQSGLVKRRGMTSYDYKSDGAELVNGWSLSKGEYQNKSLNIGRELLTRIREIESKQNNAESAALAIVYSGDWELLFGDESAATRLYKQGYQSLIESGLSTEIANTFFDRPVILPQVELLSSVAEFQRRHLANSNVLFNAWSPNFPAAKLPEFMNGNTEPSPSFHATVFFDRSLDATATIELSTHLQPQQMSLLAQARKKLQEDIATLTFRPKIDNGELVPRTKIAVDYFYSPTVEPAILSSQ